MTPSGEPQRTERQLGGVNRVGLCWCREHRSVQYDQDFCETAWRLQRSGAGSLMPRCGTVPNSVWQSLQKSCKDAANGRLSRRKTPGGLITARQTMTGSASHGPDHSPLSDRSIP